LPRRRHQQIGRRLIPALGDPLAVPENEKQVIPRRHLAARPVDRRGLVIIGEGSHVRYAIVAAHDTTRRLRAVEETVE
jgi:hypothetical protein